MQTFLSLLFLNFFFFADGNLNDGFFGLKDGFATPLSPFRRLQQLSFLLAKVNGLFTLQTLANDSLCDFLLLFLIDDSGHSVRPYPYHTRRTRT